MDEIDEKILEILKRDARTPNAKIGKAVKLSEAAVRKRIRNMVASGVIKRFTVEIREKVPPLSALIFIAVEEKTPTEKITKSILALENVQKVFEITGEFDICVLVSASEVGKMNALIDKIRDMEGVRDTKTQVILKTWG